MKIARPLLMLGLVALLSACARTPAARYYVLAGPDAAVAGERTGPLIGLGPVNLPSYLDRPQIVTRAGDNRLELAPRERWAEPFAESFRRALFEQVAAARPDVRLLNFPWKSSLPLAARVTLDVQRFDRGSDGAVVLLARWSVASDKDSAAPAQRASRIAVPVSAKADDYDALVAAHAQAVAQLAKEIAAALAP
ncbi:MAG: PqiC family protein [Gammaproteobacteria bacterium]|nr:PqiC family protein [Gammaproteobacteria bacterium]